MLFWYTATTSGLYNSQSITELDNNDWLPYFLEINLSINDTKNRFLNCLAKWQWIFIMHWNSLSVNYLVLQWCKLEGLLNTIQSTFWYKIFIYLYVLLNDSNKKFFLIIPVKCMFCEKFSICQRLLVLINIIVHF